MTRRENSGPDESGFEQSARERLRRHAERVPDDVAARLAAARRRAVATLDDGDRARWLDRWFSPAFGFSAAGAAAVVVLAVALFFFDNASVPAVPPGFISADEAELTAAHEAELLDELEFLAWLEAADVDAG